ncbi:uncharacterized protein LOC129617127 [Condylostylus longicornis]|uniref:uncharacterized protein LOC129617127 n=1 Tax=Condylostylus longicornis TaxID=2530218 RepID=UPI00244DFC51|nr:uncharacterized protein LOC129617127 [Condylostylus longicornis]
MRPLKEEESKIVFEKLAKFVGNNLVNIVDNKENPHVFRLQKDRVFIVSAKVCKFAGSVPRKNLISLGTCIGKFSKTKKFRLHVTSLPWIARFATHKVWVKPAGEQSFIYGNHVLKRHLGRVTEQTDKNAGVVVLSMGDVPLGFGVTSRSTSEMRASDTEAIVVFHQSDVGEYLREEADLI